MMNCNPLISIIVPVFNLESYLSRCLDSIIQQSYQNIEVIVVNDGSTDNSGEICEAFKRKDNRIRIFHKKNGGVSAARNLGLEHASGAYIGFVDGDDYITADMYDFLLTLSTSHNADIASCSYYIVDNGRLTEGKGIHKSCVLTKEQGIIRCIRKQDFFGAIWSHLYKRSCIRNLWFEPRLKRSEDYYFNFLAYCNSEKTVHKGEPKYYYVSRDNSASKDDINLDTIFIARKILATIRKKYPGLEPVAHYRDLAETVSALHILDTIKDAAIKTGYNKKDLLGYLKQYQGKIWSNPHIPGKYKILLTTKRINDNLFLKAVSFYLNAKRSYHEISKIQ